MASKVAVLSASSSRAARWSRSGFRPGEDHLRPLSACSSGGFKPDAGTTADHDDSLPEEFRVAPGAAGTVSRLLLFAIHSLRSPLDHKGARRIGSNVAPITTSFPFGPRPLINSDIAFELGAAARMTCAPPSFCSAFAAFAALLSMYTLAPSFFASAAFSEPRAIAATL